MRLATSHMDRVGMATSTLCAIHCAVLPFVIGLLPLIGLSFVANSLFEWGMVGFAAIVGTISLFRGHKVHRKHTAFCFFVPGLALVLAGLMFFSCVCSECGLHKVYGYDISKKQMVVVRTVPVPQKQSFPWRAIVMAMGGISIATAHFVNMRLCRTCHTCHPEEAHRGVG